MKKLLFIIALSFYSSCNSAEILDALKIKKAGEIHKIIERAERQYPDDYSMQRYEIKMQTQALIEVETLKYLIDEKNHHSKSELKLPAKSTEEARKFYASLAEIDNKRFN